MTPLGDSGGTASFAGLRYGDVSAYRQLPPGRYAIAVRAAGAGAPTPAPLSLAVDLADGAARTVALDAGFADLRLDAITDDLAPPAAGTARLRVIAAAASSPAVDVSVVDGPPLASRLSFPGAGPEVDVAAGSRSLRVTSGGSTTLLPLDVPAGAVLSLLVLDAPGGGVTVRSVTDAAGPAVVPVGPVDAGGGGTASPGPCRPVLACLFSAVAPSTPPAARVPVAAAWGPLPAPRRLVVPGAGIDAPLVAVTTDESGALAAPGDPRTAGWLQAGPVPGAAGPAVLAGHVDTVAGPAVFFRLRLARPGDTVLVVRADGSVATFVVDRVASYPKTAFPTAEVYGPTPDPELRLITCGGPFDRAARSYLDNLVVFAHLAG